MSESANQTHIAEALKYINETPALLSLLYDMDLLPEQVKEGTVNWTRMMLLTAAFRKSQTGTKMNDDKLQKFAEGFCYRALQQANTPLPISLILKLVREAAAIEREKLGPWINHRSGCTLTYDTEFKEVTKCSCGLAKLQAEVE